MTTVLITGGTGLVGSALTAALLKKGYRVIILTRSGNTQSGNPSLSYAKWDVDKGEIDQQSIEAADYIIHLAGAGVADKRWTKKRKQEIVDSRVKSGELLVRSLRNTPNKIKAVISASAIGWYGADRKTNGSSAFTEEAPPSDDFLGQTCKQWESSTEPIKESGIRLVKFRIGIVLSEKGGALKEFLKPLRFGLATILGGGKQIISWVHIDDLVTMFISAMEKDTFNGVYNAVAPVPVSNKDLMLQLARTKNKFFIPVPVPAFVLKIMLGEMSIEVLKSTTVSAEKIRQAGFEFKYDKIEAAVKSF